MDRSHLKGVEPAQTNGLDSSRRTNYSSPANGVADTPSAEEAFLDLNKIREILFGVERRETSNKVKDLEDRLEAQAVQSELEIQRRMEAFEEQIKEEVRAIGSEIGAAQQQTADRLEATAVELKTAMAQLTRQMEELSARSTATEQDLRAQIGQHVEGLGDAIRRNHEEISSALDQKTRELRADSVDWAGFGSILGDLANQVSAKRPR